VTDYEPKLKAQIAPYLEPGETVLSAVIARPRGATMAQAGLAGQALGGHNIRRNNRAGTEAGLELANPMVLALTDRRLLVLKATMPIALGKGGDIKSLVSSATLADVDSIEAKRLLAGGTVTVTVRGTSFKLEAGKGTSVKSLAAEFERARSALAPS
jgi:hypothetical protein